MPQYPRSAYDLTGGVCYFARMLDKIRLHDAGDLPKDYQGNLGIGFDGRMCSYLHVDYAKVREQVLRDASDDAVLEWCYVHGKRLSDLEILVWNGFARKRGWRDDDGGSEILARNKATAGLADRDDILTMFEFYEADEKRGD